MTVKGGGRASPVSQMAESVISEDVAAVAHDLCNHLQVVSSALNVIQRSFVTEQRGNLDFVFNGAWSSLQRAGRLSRRIVNSRAAASSFSERLALGQRIVALHEVLTLAAGPGIVVHRFIDEGIPDVECAAEALDDTILNLVVNSRHAMPSGGVIWITVTTDPGAMGGAPTVVLQVADTGCGMPPEVAARAFDARYTTKPRDAGSGLGLSAVVAFARSAGGTVELETAPGAGTTITIRLPGLLKQVHAKSLKG